MDRPLIRILNLEDSAIDADLILRELKRAKLDFSIARVETEQDFQAALSGFGPDVILADYNLPGFDGVDALRIARSKVPEVPFIFVSGSIGEERAIQALREGATDYVIKDRLNRLPSAVTRALAEKRERHLRERTQEALHRSEERFRYAAKATQEVIWDRDLVTDRMTFNDALRTVWGYDMPGNECDARWWEERIHPEEREAVLQSLRTAIESGDDRWGSEYRFQRANKTYGNALHRSVIIRNQHGVAYRKICGMLDITEQRRADERVQESELLFRSVAETAGDAIILSDVDGRIVFWNEGATRLFGYTSSEIAGYPLTFLIPERNREAYAARLKSGSEAALAGKVIEFDGLRKDGREFPLEMSLTVWKSGGETFFTRVMRDISRRVTNERRQRLQFAVAQTLSESMSNADLPSQLLENVGRELRWQMGTWWANDRERGELRCTEAWVAPDFASGELLQLSKTLVLRFGEGFPGLVALSGQAVAADPTQPYDNIEQFPRAEAARKAGIRYSVAFPVVEHGEVTAVVEFLKTRPAVADDEFLDLLTDIGRRVGEFFERRRAEETLAESTASLADAQEIAKLGSFSLDTRTGVVAWSAQTFHIFGIGPQEFDGSFGGYLARIHPDDVEFVRAQTTPPLKDTTFGFRHRIVRPDQEIRFVQCSVRVAAGTAESPERIVGTIQDITEQVEAEETILRLSRQTEMILNSATEGIIGIDTSGRVTFANPAAAALTGWSIEELVSSQNMHALIHHSRPGGEPYPEDECPVSRVLLDGRARSGEETFWKQSGESFSAYFNSSAIIENDRIIGCVVMFEDITKRKRLEHDLEQANRVSGLGRVAATIAHEFNNVLMGIQPFAEVIRRRSADEKVLKAAAQIATSVTRGKRVTEEILRFTQPAEPSRKPIEVGEWLQNMLPELQGLVGQRVEIALLLPDEPVTIQGDAVQLQQVMTNLVLNGRDAITGAGTITIRLQARTEEEQFSFGQLPPGLALLTVRDTGSGMKPEVLNNIFEPLFTTKRTGTGLGLAVAQQVISRHGGSIHAESSLGKGTTFFIVLPTVSTSEVAESGADPQKRDTVVRRIVVVEDEEVVATGIALLLESEGVQVRVADHGAAAIETIEGFDPDAVVLDISLPDMDGPEVYRRIAAAYPTLPVLFSSGHGDQSSVEEYFKTERVAFLRKPYDLETLLAALEKITRKSLPSQRSK